MPAALEKLELEQQALEEILADAGLYQRDPEEFERVTKRLGGNEEEQLALLERVEAVEARIAELQALC